MYIYVITERLFCDDFSHQNFSCRYQSGIDKGGDIDDEDLP